MPKPTVISAAPWRRGLLVLFTVLVLALFAYQFVQLVHTLDGQQFVTALGRPGRWRYAVLAVLLMPLNWGLEARKWQLLLNVFLDWPFSRTLRATLAGVSVSAATPNRIGEVGGRLLLANRTEWSGVMASSLLGSLCQWAAFLLLAWPALVYTLRELPATILPIQLSVALYVVGPALIGGLLLGGTPLLDRLLGWVERRFKRSTGNLREALANVKFTLMLRASVYASLRFCVYCIQLYLLLWFFGLELAPVNGLAGIAAIYLVQAGLPLPPGLNFVTRTELGLLLWQADAAGTVAVLAAYTTLFGVNVLLPALPGYWLIVRKNRMQ